MKEGCRGIPIERSPELGTAPVPGNGGSSTLQQFQVYEGSVPGSGVAHHGRELGLWIIASEPTPSQPQDMPTKAIDSRFLWIVLIDVGDLGVQATEQVDQRVHFRR